MSFVDPARARVASALGPFGEHALDALERVESVRFCSPDASLDALDAGSVRGLRDLVDELDAAARASPLTPRGDPWECPVVLTRSMREASQRWLDAWSAVASAASHSSLSGICCSSMKTAVRTALSASAASNEPPPGPG